MGNQPSSTPKTTLYYHGACKKFLARSIPILLTLQQAKVEYDIKDTSEAPPDSGFAVPMLQFSDGQIISQTIAILTALGETYHLNGSTPEEKNTCLQTLLDFNDIASELKGGKFTADSDRLPKWMGMLETRLTTKYFGGDSPTTADFYGVFVMVFLDGRLGTSYRESFPKLMQWCRDIDQVPVVKKMKDGSVSLTPPKFHKK